MPQVESILMARRQYLQLTQQELAELAQVSVRFIRELEAGRANPGLRQFTQLLDALGLELSITEKKHK